MQGLVETVITPTMWHLFTIFKSNICNWMCEVCLQWKTDQSLSPIYFKKIGKYEYWNDWFVDLKIMFWLFIGYDPLLFTFTMFIHVLWKWSSGFSNWTLNQDDSEMIPYTPYIPAELEPSSWFRVHILNLMFVSIRVSSSSFLLFSKI